MTQVNMFEAKTSLSKLVEMIERGQEREIIIARHGRPAAKLVAVGSAPASRRIGVAKGKLKVPDDIDVYNDEIAGLFLGKNSP